MMEDELVRRRRWLSRDKFLDLLGASNLIPGPSSSELAIHIGYLRAGWVGLLVAGICFILPAAIIVAAGFTSGSVVFLQPLPSCGVKPVVISVVAQALWGLGKTAVKTTSLGFVGAISLVLAFFGLHPLLLLAMAGGLACVAQAKTVRFQAIAMPIPPVPTFSAASFGLSSLFLVFLKFGAVVFGSGYVLLAFLRADLVVHHRWLTDSQLIDAVAVGQVTPGPVFTTATFIGYLLGGVRGALVATVGIFIPALFFGRGKWAIGTTNP
jgi:chromate transporter